MQQVQKIKLQKSSGKKNKKTEKSRAKRLKIRKGKLRKLENQKRRAITSLKWENYFLNLRNFPRTEGARFSIRKVSVKSLQKKRGLHLDPERTFTITHEW